MGSSLESRHHPWTLCGLIQAFVDLGLAYVLLCASTLAFFASRFLGIVGLSLPCPCRGLFGFQPRDRFCWHRLLVDWPVDKIRQVLALLGRLENGLGSAPRESGCDAKGKRVANPKQRSGIRRRRRAALAYGKFGSGFPGGFGETSGLVAGQEYGPLEDVDIMPSGGRNGDFDVEEERRPFVGSEPDRIRALERALEEEKAACSALYLELEKERAAAATAADEAMAMISRLQNDKATMEVEARQYERMIEEKFAYDEDEIVNLKEILVRKERDNHFLEKEIETYRRMSVTGDEQSNDDISDIALDDWGQRPLYSPYQNHLKNDADFPLSPFAETQSQCDGRESVEKTVILVDHVDRTAMLDSVPEDILDSHDIVYES